MTVFKTFLKILNKNKFIVILYTVLLIAFGGFTVRNSDTTLSFVQNKPDILIVNYDEEKGITKDFIKYIKENSNTPKVEDNESAREDALFYEDASLIVYIKENFNDDFISGKNPEIEIKKGSNYNSSYSEMIVKRYLEVASIYQKSFNNEDELIRNINETLFKKSDVKILSKLDTNSLNKANQFFNFSNYSILACLIYVICLILSTFNDDKIRKRTIISSMDYKKNNRILLLSNTLYAFIMWLFYVILSFILVGDVMKTSNGILYIINSLVFTVCATSIAFLIGTIIKSKNAVSGIVNVVALGSSFLSGSFVPMEFLPDSVLKIAHILPSYYYIKTNETIKTLEIFNFEKLKPIYINMGIILLFSIIFIIISNIITNKKRKLS